MSDRSAMRRGFWCVRSMLAACCIGATSVCADDAKEWSFQVLLDGDFIGYHQFRLREGDGGRELVTTADFDVKILFLTAYRYRHTNRERWVGDCVSELSARTDDNGEAWTVRGMRESGAFVVETNQRKVNLPECVMTFAYWNPDMLLQKRLLNAQTGEYVEINVIALETESLSIGNSVFDAKPFVVDAGELSIKLWYTQDDHWLALETITETGKTLRYQMEERLTAALPGGRCDAPGSGGDSQAAISSSGASKRSVRCQDGSS